MAQRVYKTLLKPGPDDARAQLEELALRLEPGEYAVGERLRARSRPNWSAAAWPSRESPCAGRATTWMNGPW